MLIICNPLVCPKGGRRRENGRDSEGTSFEYSMYSGSLIQRFVLPSDPPSQMSRRTFPELRLSNPQGHFSSVTFPGEHHSERGPSLFLALRPPRDFSRYCTTFKDTSLSFNTGSVDRRSYQSRGQILCEERPKKGRSTAGGGAASQDLQMPSSGLAANAGTTGKKHLHVEIIKGFIR